MSRVPRLLPGQNLSSLGLTQSETFLVSQIDASLSEADLAFITGLSEQQVSATLDRLARAGAVAFAGGGRHDGEPQRGSPYPSGVRAAPPPPPRAESPPRSMRSPTYDPAELDEPADLELEKKRRILDLFYRIDNLTYYEMLGVDRQADKKQVKSAYYSIAPEFHPDKFFRKNLGSFQPKIEVIFARLTLAHDTLAEAQRRKEYDEYLATTQKNRAMSAALDSTEDELAMIEEAVRQSAATAVSRGAPTPPNGAAARMTPAPMSAPFYDGAAGGPKPRAPSEPVPSAPSQVNEEALRLRREALARKLTGATGRRTGPMPRVTPTARPAEVDPEAAARAAEALQRRHEAAVAEGKRQQLQRYLDTGRAALEKQDFAAAANAFRIAASLEPDNPQVQATCNEAMRLTATALADGYFKQGQYEESQERWAEAALSYSKVCTGRPEDALAHERVAFATLKSSANVRRAVDFARKAVELAPRSPEFRITLARAYAAAGLEKSKNGELDRALELAPGNPRIQGVVAQVRALAPKDGKVS